MTGIKQVIGEKQKKYWRSMDKDKCVLCEKDTPYTKETHIDYRLNYIEGAGQMCEGCYEKTYD